MDDFDSGWDETPSSLDSENMNNYDINNDSMNAYKSAEIKQQMCLMRSDPNMSYQAINAINISESENKDCGNSSVDYSSLSSEIFLATRLLHDETLDTSALTTLAEHETPPYNEHQNFNSYLENSSQHEDTVDSIGLPQHEALDSEFLYNNFEQQVLTYDEDNSNKSWTESLPPTEIMPATVLTVSRKQGEKKPKGERKKRVIKIKVLRKKQTLAINNEELNSETVKPNVSYAVDTVISEELPGNKTEADSAIKSNTTSVDEYIQKYTLNSQPIEGPDSVLPSTSGNNIQTKDGRKVPNYLNTYRLRDDKYAEIYACKHCYGIFTTLDSAMFHPCLKKRRGRRPKILENCQVP